MRLAGAMTIHAGMQPEFCELVINDLARHVEALFILENGHAPPEALNAPKFPLVTTLTSPGSPCAPSTRRSLAPGTGGRMTRPWSMPGTRTSTM